jgi:hypothetical protein
MSYLIHNGELLATTSEDLKSGDTVAVAHNTCEQVINASIDLNLVNAFSAKVSNAKKWNNNYADYVAVAINNSTDEFVLR